jgi:hypothetical protein
MEQKKCLKQKMYRNMEHTFYADTFIHESCSFRDNYTRGTCMLSPETGESTDWFLPNFILSVLAQMCRTAWTFTNLQSCDKNGAVTPQSYIRTLLTGPQKLRYQCTRWNSKEKQERDAHELSTYRSLRSVRLAEAAGYPRLPLAPEWKAVKTLHKEMPLL